MISREAEIVGNTPKITPEEAVKMRYPSYNHNRYGVVSIIGPTPDGTCYVKIQNSFPTEWEAREDAQQAVQKGYIHFDLYVIDLQTFFQVPAPKEEEQKIKEVTNMDPRLNKYLSRQKLEQEKQLENIKHRMKCKKKKTVYAKYEEFVLSQAKKLLHDCAFDKYFDCEVQRDEMSKNFNDYCDLVRKEEELANRKIVKDAFPEMIDEKKIQK